MIDDKRRQEAIRLRVEERKSLNEIRDTLKIAKGTLSVLLRPYPLTKEEIGKRLSNSLKRNGHNRVYVTKERGVKSKFYDMVAKQTLSTSRKGNLAEAAVIFRLILLGHVVSKPVFDGAKSDLLVEDARGTVKRIQVKFAKTNQRGLPSCSLRCSNGRHSTRRYDDSEFDVLVAYDLFSDTAFVYTVDELKQHNTKSVGWDAAERWDKIFGAVA